MALNTEERKDIVYFTGFEVEHTICYEMYTLFVVGTPPLDEILEQATSNHVKQIYFGTSQSFNPATHQDWQEWDKVITGCLNAGYWVALDFDSSYASEHMFSQVEWNEYEKFVPMISVKLPNIKKFNYNATVKIDDTTWGHSNPGVWTHQLNELTVKDKFTHWDLYTEDTNTDNH